MVEKVVFGQIKVF